MNNYMLHIYDNTLGKMITFWQLASRRSFRVLLLALMICWICLTRIDSLAPFRSVSGDEQLYVGTAIGLLDGTRTIPASLMWSHIFPEFSNVAFHPPLFFLLYGVVFRVFGLSAFVVGLFQLLTGLIACLAYFLLLKKMELDPFRTAWGVALMLAFVLFAWVGGQIGRPENANILLLALCGLLLVDTHICGNNSGMKLFLTGAVAGIGTLIHINFWTYSFPLIAYYILSRGGRLKAARYLLPVSLGFVLVFSLWIFWWLPYSSENLRIWTRFILPDQQNRNINLNVIFLIIQNIIRGPYSSESDKRTWLSSSFLVMALLSLLICYRPKRNAILNCLTMTVMSLVTIVTRAHPQKIIMIYTFIILILPIMVRNGNRKFVDSRIIRYFVIAILLFQSMSTAIYRIANFGGDYYVLSQCGQPHMQILQRINSDSKVLTSDGFAFYHLAGRSKVFWPSGLYGTTPGGVFFTTNYENYHFDYAVFQASINEIDDPGMKFTWSQSPTRQFYKNHFELLGISKIKCESINAIGRFSSVPRTLYVYKARK